MGNLLVALPAPSPPLAAVVKGVMNCPRTSMASQHMAWMRAAVICACAQRRHQGSHTLFPDAPRGALRAPNKVPAPGLSAR